MKMESLPTSRYDQAFANMGMRSTGNKALISVFMIVMGISQSIRISSWKKEN